MTPHVRHAALSALLVAALAAAASAAPPRVVRVTPAHGEDLVDPSLTELRVEFDQAMSAGVSWVGGGESFPKVTAPPRWETPRACVLPVTMRPDHVYRLSINGGKFLNFRSATGQPATPYPVVFRTGPADAALRAERAAAAPDEATHRAAVAALRRSIKTRYSYRDRLGIDWDALIAEHEPRLVSSSSAFQFAARAAPALAAARDMHLWFVAGGEAFPSHRRDVYRNYDLESITRRLDDDAWPSRTVLTGRVAGVPYLCITTFEASVDAALDAIREHRESPGIIIDVRPNAGGDERRARAIAGCFVSEPVVYARHRSVDPDAPGGFTGIVDRTLIPNPDVPRFDGEVIVLMGPVNMSSCEAFLLMMKQVRRCTLLGMPSYGSSGNPKPVELPNGVTVMLPSWQGLLPDGTSIEAHGIEPDVLLRVIEEQLRPGDPLLDEAAGRLNR